MLAEGGTHDQNHFALSGQTMLSRGWGLSASLSSLNSNGPVQNSDYRNDMETLELFVSDIMPHFA